MKYGYFDDTKKEYVITRPDTPVKWINYIGTLAFGGIVDQTGGSLITKGDPALNRINKYIPQLPASDFKGESLFVRIKTQDGYKVITPYFTPGLKPHSHYECHVGLSYQTIITEIEDVRTEVRIFVPTDTQVVIRDIKITNLSDEEREIDVIPVVEFSHFDALKQYTNADWVPQTMTVDAHWQKDKNLILQQYAFMKKEYAQNFFTSNFPADSFQTDRKLFLGKNEYGSWQNPLELQNESLSNYQARRGDNIAAILHKLGKLKKGESKRIITQLGQEHPDKIPALVQTYRDEKEVDKAFEKLAEFWDSYLSNAQYYTPDFSFNTMVNIHNPRQCHTTYNWSRYLSLYQLGLGARGLGFRDSSQDVLGILPFMPQEAKKLIKKLLSVQKSDGSAMHQFYPLTMEANEGDSQEEEGHKYYGDDHLWIILAVSAYLRETGDYDFLKEEITFYDKNLPLEERQQGSVLEHLKRALTFTKYNTGWHDLPLLGFADWNDTVNLRGNAESVFIANLYGRALLEIIDLMQHLQQDDLVKKYQSDYDKMKKTLNDNAWDGEWYLRYFDEEGKPLGSHTNKEGKIYTNAQSWSILSDFAPEDKAKKALESVYKNLNTKFGIKLSAPGYNGYDPAKGGITTYPPGAKENGGIFLHSNPWVMIAETKMGNGDRAFQYYQQINPASKNDIIDRYECEPYCYAQNILGDEHPQFGLARNSWLSGTASWTYIAATQFILGIRPQHNGLKIDPSIPKHWKEFSAIRKYRNATYHIKVVNPEGVSKGIKKISIDNKTIKDNVLPIFGDNKTHIVLVEMGKQ